jgi:endonuclease/exonuclease/phosphatase family metal-dependent hydrolase
MHTQAILLCTLGLACVSAASQARFRVVTFNIHAFRTAEHADNLESVFKVLEREQPDVVCLNEVIEPFAAPDPEDPYWREVRERRGVGCACPPGSRPEDPAATALARLSGALRLKHCVFGVANEGGFFGPFPFGNAILSRYELVDVRHELMRVTDADLTLGAQSRTRADLEDRGVTTARVLLPGGAGALGVAVVHLDHKAEELRERQIREAIDHCDASFADRLPYLLMGDLNTFDRRDLTDEGWADICGLYAERGWPPPLPRSLVQQALRRAGFVDAWAVQEAARGARPPPTCWTKTRLDYVLLSRSAAGGRAEGDEQDGGATGLPAARRRRPLRVISHRTLQCDASDHLPVVIDLEVDGASV